MKIPNIITNNPVIAAAVAAGLIGVLWLTLRGAKGMGQDIGAGAVNLAAGVVGVATSAIVDNANDPNVNPLYNVGTSLGGFVFDLFNDPVTP